MELNNENSIKVTIFAQKRKMGFSYLTTLTIQETGDKITLPVTFNEKAEPNPKECPCDILADRNKSFVHRRIVTDDIGRLINFYTLRIKNYRIIQKWY